MAVLGSMEGLCNYDCGEQEISRLFYDFALHERTCPREGEIEKNIENVGETGSRVS